MPQGEEIVLLGDLVDRGQYAPEVIQWAIDNNVKAVMGNHEHMMLDYYNNHLLEVNEPQYHNDVWFCNGGWNTHRSYSDRQDMLQKHLTWLTKLPYYIERDDILLSHAACVHDIPLEKQCLGEHPRILWNRHNPTKRDKFQAFGHNSNWGLTWFKQDDKPWAVCLDDSHKETLTGMHWPSMEVFQEPYLKGSHEKR